MKEREEWLTTTKSQVQKKSWHFLGTNAFQMIHLNTVKCISHFKLCCQWWWWCKQDNILIWLNDYLSRVSSWLSSKKDGLDNKTRSKPLAWLIYATNWNDRWLGGDWTGCGTGANVRMRYFCRHRCLLPGESEDSRIRNGLHNSNQVPYITWHSLNQSIDRYILASWPCWVHESGWLLSHTSSWARPESLYTRYEASFKDLALMIAQDAKSFNTSYAIEEQEHSSSN